MRPENIPVVYIAGPYRAATRCQVHRNIRNAEEIGAAVMALGAMPIIPHANTFFADGAFPDEFFLMGDLAILAKCDAMVLCPGWSDSEGCMGEVRFAGDHDIPDFSWRWDKAKFKRWLARWKAERMSDAV